MDQVIFTKLRTILAELYSDEASIRRVIGDAGIDSARVSFGTNAQNCWHSILTEANKIRDTPQGLKPRGFCVASTGSATVQ